MDRIDYIGNKADNAGMLPLLFGLVIFFFLTIGSVAFVVCFTTPFLRPRALTCALWFAAWGPCIVAWMMLAGLALVSEAFIGQTGADKSLHLPRIPVALGWGYVLLAVVSTAMVASCIAWLHETIIERFTFALFRLYATTVAAGIGSVFGWILTFWITANIPLHFGWLLGLGGMSIFIAGFGTMTYRTARTLRGNQPSQFPWVTPEEFAGQ